MEDTRLPRPRRHRALEIVPIRLELATLRMEEAFEGATNEGLWTYDLLIRLKWPPSYVNLA
jgi:hypothetical protein